MNGLQLFSCAEPLPVKHAARPAAAGTAGASKWAAPAQAPQRTFGQHLPQPAVCSCDNSSDFALTCVVLAVCAYLVLCAVTRLYIV